MPEEGCRQNARTQDADTAWDVECWAQTQKMGSGGESVVRPTSYGQLLLTTIFRKHPGGLRPLGPPQKYKMQKYRKTKEIQNKCKINAK